MSRIEETLPNLFESFLPFDIHADNDPAVTDWANRLIKNASRTVRAGAEAHPPDVNSAQDLIKRKLLKENASPEKAARFSNLYSRLLSQPVLSQKWGMLYLLYSLSTGLEPQSPQVVNSPPADTDAPKSARLRRQDRFLGRRPQSDNVNGYTRASMDEPVSADNSPRGPPKPVNGQQEALVQSEQRKSRDGPSLPSENKQQPLSVPNELDLLRDIPFNMQGVSSASYKFISADTVKLPPSLPIPILSLLNTLAEPCLLYRRLAASLESAHGGLVHQSLRAAISAELRSYLGLVATLESEIRRAVMAIEKGHDNPKSVRASGVTLKRCVVWTRDATMGLRLMSLIIERSQTIKGGQIISLIHNLLSTHGDPFVAGFAERLLTHVARPFYDMLRHWIYDGELVDPYFEFFVVEADPNDKANIDPRRVAMSIWEDKYKLETPMVPSIVSDEFARKVFLIGKSLNFIRHNCGDSDWVIQYSQNHSKALDHANTANLSSSIDSAYRTTMSRLTHLMSSKFLLFTHLHALKKYLLLGQGDFMELLVESLAPNLDRPASSQYRHTLTSQLEHAIRHSNAQYDDPEVLRRLDARMVELTRGDTGWDCFTLEYKITAPCDVVITQWANIQYLKIFNVMLRVKRVEYSLNTTWRKCMTGARGVLSAVNEDLSEDWKKARCTIAEMVHFVNQLQYYILVEVIEASWEDLQQAMHKPDATLDDLIEAHTIYINRIVQKGLLASSAEREDGFLPQLHSMLKSMLSYRDVVESLYSFSVAEYTRKQQFSARIERRTAAGRWGITEKDFDSRSSTPALGKSDRQSIRNEDGDSPILLPNSAGNEQALLHQLRSTLKKMSLDFKAQINSFLYDLAHQSDVDLRFLGVVMNFNEAYKPVNPRRQQRRDRARREAAGERKGKDSGSISSSAAFSSGVEQPKVD